MAQESCPCRTSLVVMMDSRSVSFLQNLQVLFMRSDGGLTPMHSFSGSRAILSGPAGGVVGYAITTYQPENPQPVIGFDMGGEI